MEAPLREMEEVNIWKSEENSISSPSPLGQVTSMLLDSRPRKLEAAISRFDSASSRSSSAVLLDDSLCFLRRHAKDAAEKGEPLDQILVPMIEHSLNFKGPKHCKQVLTLISWLFQDEFLCQVLSSNLAEIIMTKEDNYIAFGWCALVSSLVELTMNKSSDKGKQEKHIILVRVLCQSFSRLLSIICKGSTLQGEFELPTRLSVAAADCILVVTEALVEAASCWRKSCDSKSESQFVMSIPSNSKTEIDFTARFSQGLEDAEMEHLLWGHLDELIILVQKLQAWSRKSRPLHAKGCGQVLKWLQEIKRHYGYLQRDTGGELLRSGMLLLCSCWKHYAVLLRLEDHRFSQHYREMLEQYISAIQFYTQNKDSDHIGEIHSSIETRKFFLNCLSLLWGRLDGKQRETVTSQSGQQLLNLLFSQLQFDDDDLIEGAMNILRAIIFNANFSSGSSLLDTSQMEAVLPLLLSFLDERDSTARAAVLFFAEYCSLNPDGQGLQEMFRHLKLGNHCQKRNAIDVISELTRLSSDSGKILSASVRQDIAAHLLECLGDEQLTNHVEASNLLPHLDPLFVLPALVQLVYSGNEKVRVSASDAIIVVLRCHNQNHNVILTLLNCLSNINGNPELPKNPEGMGETQHGSSKLFQNDTKLDVDRVLELIPKWSESVQNWSLLIEQVINKMFQDPSNANVVQFMSYINEHLVEAGDLVLHRVFLHMQGQKEVDKSWFSDGNGTFSSDNFAKMKGSLFDRLSPLLLLRLLPLRVFDDLDSSTLYGNIFYQDILQDGDICIRNHDCVAALLLSRAFSQFEFEDVRKLAAELCGRLHPQVLLPVIESQLNHAAQSRDILKMKACLFAVCTSLVVRDRVAALHPVMSRIRKILEMVLSWPSLDADEVSKAQHGCIDCLALMICAELKTPVSPEDFTMNRISIIRHTSPDAGDAASTNSVLTYVIQRLTCDKNANILTGASETACYKESCSSDRSQDTLPSISEDLSNESTAVPFRLCMANVLISACQKVSSSEKQMLACRTLPSLIFSVEMITCSDIRAACLQVLFSAVYHLKSSILPFSSDLLKLSVKALKKGSEKERIAAAKLMASLMASEDVVVDSISGGLLEAKSVLGKVALKDSSSELRQLCKKLLVCVTSPLDAALRSLISEERGHA